MMVPVGAGFHAASRAVSQWPTQQRLWAVVRLLSIAVSGVGDRAESGVSEHGLAGVLDGADGLSAPAVLVAPGVWRNVCPLAALNGLPHRLGKGGTRRWSAKAQRRTPYIAPALFFLVVPLRSAGLDRDGLALALFLGLLLGAAFGGGLLFSGKAGWCSQICPMLAVERLYAMSPLVVVRDTHCRPCVGCTRNCYDLQPTTVALNRPDRPRPRPTGTGAPAVRRGDAVVLRWLLYPAAPCHADHLGAARRLRPIRLFALVGAVACLLLGRYGPWSRYQLVVAHAAVALNIYYLVVVESTLTALALPDFTVGLLAHSLVMGVTVVWMLRAFSRTAASRTGHGGTPRRIARAA